MYRRFKEICHEACQKETTTTKQQARGISHCGVRPSRWRKKLKWIPIRAVFVNIVEPEDIRICLTRFSKTFVCSSSTRKSAMAVLSLVCSFCRIPHSIFSIAECLLSHSYLGQYTNFKSTPTIRGKNYILHVTSSNSYSLNLEVIMTDTTDI